MEKKNLAIVGGLGALAAYLYYTRRPCELCETCETSCEFSCQTCEISQDVPDHCGRDNPDWKHDDQIYDVTSVMNSQGYSGYWELDVTMHNGPSIISIYGPEEPPERSDKEKVQSWLSGFDLHRGFCYIDNNYYWLKYPASLTHTPYPPCLTCEVACESSCMESCEVHCQTGCEVSCEADCETACQVGCEISVEPPSPPEKRKLSIHAEEGGTTDPSPGTYYHDPLDVVRVLAIPNSGYIFDHWSLGGSKFYPNPIDVLMDADINLIAYFKEAPSPPCGTEDVPTPPPPEPGTGHVLVTSLEVESVPATTEGGCNTLHYEAVLTNPGSESATHHVEIYLEYGGTSSSIYSQDVTLEPAQTKYLANNIRMCLSGTLTVGMSVTIRVVAENEKSASVVLYPGPTPPPCTTQCEICETPFEICGVIETCGTLETCPTDVCRVSCEIPSEILPPSGIEVWVFSQPEEICPPCPLAARAAQEVASEYNVGFKDIDTFTDEGRVLAEQYNVTSTPTTVVFVDGTVKCRWEGYFSNLKDVLRDCLDQYVSIPGRKVLFYIDGTLVHQAQVSSVLTESAFDECYFAHGGKSGNEELGPPTFAGEKFCFHAHIGGEWGVTYSLFGYTAESGTHTVTAKLVDENGNVLDTCSKTYSIEAPPPEECTIDDDVWKHGDEVYDVTEVMNRNGYDGEWTLSVTMRNGPTGIELFGPTEPPAREELKMIASWQAGYDLHRGFCPKDNNYYWLHYPVELTQISGPTPSSSALSFEGVTITSSGGTHPSDFDVSGRVSNPNAFPVTTTVEACYAVKGGSNETDCDLQTLTVPAHGSSSFSIHLHVTNWCIPPYKCGGSCTVTVTGDKIGDYVSRKFMADGSAEPYEYGGGTGEPPDVWCEMCDVSCEETCEISCQADCEVACQTGCEISCEEECELSCQSACEWCMISCENCEGRCETGCEVACQTSCDVSCEDYCEKACQGACELACEENCEYACQAYCESYCQIGCEVSCETGCMVSCQASCQVSCQATCERACQTTAEYCATHCETTCEAMCMTHCEYCETSCELQCQTMCEVGHEGVCVNIEPY